MLVFLKARSLKMSGTETKDYFGKPYHFYESHYIPEKKYASGYVCIQHFFPITQYVVCGKQGCYFEKAILYATLYVFNGA